MLLAVHNPFVLRINRWAHFLEEINNFIKKMGVVLFLRMDLFGEIIVHILIFIDLTYKVYLLALQAQKEMVMYTSALCSSSFTKCLNSHITAIWLCLHLFALNFRHV